MPKPNFLVVGVGRSGTTSLHHYLNEHPDVFVPSVKSPSYFYAVDAPDKGRLRRRETRNYFIDDQLEYLSLFDRSDGIAARGEVSPAYMSSTRVPDRIASELDDVRIIAVLRNPTDRLVARFIARRRDGLESAETVGDVVRREVSEGTDLSDTAGTYVAAGFITHVLARYIELFGNERVSLHLYDDFIRDSRQVLTAIFDFLGVDSNFPVDTSVKHNSSRGAISNPLKRAMWQRSAPVRQLVRPFIPESTRNNFFDRMTSRTTPVVVSHDEREMIDEIYVDEVRSLAKLLDRDLMAWIGNR